MDIKVIAFVCMTIDHVAVAFLRPGLLYYSCRMVGRLAFPLFVYGIVRGYRYTSDRKRYILRVFLLGVVSQIPYVAVFKLHRLNVLFELCGILLVLSGIEHLSFKRLTVLMAGLWLCSLSEYGFRGLLFALSIHLFRYRPRLRLPASLLFAGCLNTGFYQVSAFAAPLAEFMAHKNYSKKLPRSFYLLYPAHLAVIAVVKGIV